jgi:phytoene synthase
MTDASLAELRELCLAREPDRYFAATLAPKALRYDLIVLAAFAAELSRIPGQVREPMAGEIRLQWWRDALLGNSGDVAAGNPVAEAMRATITRFALPYDVVESVIDAPTEALHGERPADENAMRARLAAGEGSLFKLAARICSDGRADDLGKLAEGAGLAYGLARVLARYPTDDAVLLAIPASLASDADLPPTGDRACDTPALQSARLHLAGIARQARDDAIAALTRMSRRQRVAFLPLAMVRPNLRALQRVSTRPETIASNPLPISRLIRMAWAHASGRF